MSIEGTDDLGRQVDQTMRMFERSRVGSSETVTPVVPTRVLLILDGSNQDEASIAAAAHLRQRANTETVILDASQASDIDLGDNSLAIAAVDRITGSRSISRGPGEPYEAILAAAAQVDPDMLIVPCPLGRSIDSLGSDSTGTVADVLMARCTQPILFIRQPDHFLEAAAGRVRVLVGAEASLHQRAAAWAFGMIADHGEVTLNLVIDREHFENIRAIIEALHPEDDLDVSRFSEAMTQNHGSLHAAMSRTASGRGLNYRLIPQTAEVAPPHAASGVDPILMVMSLEAGDQFNAGFVRDRLRHSPHPVLVVTDPASAKIEASS